MHRRLPNLPPMAAPRPGKSLSEEIACFSVSFRSADSAGLVLRSVMMTTEQRLIELEVKFSHQDLLIEELRQTLHEQYLAIEKLEKNLKVLTDQIKGSEDIRGNEKPPHY